MGISHLNCQTGNHFRGDVSIPCDDTRASAWKLIKCFWNDSYLYLPRVRHSVSGLIT